MVFFALLMTPFFASLNALSARRSIAAGPVTATPFDTPFFRGLFAIIAVHIPCLGYLYYRFPDWSLAYLIEPGRLPLSFGFFVASFSFSGYFFFYLGTQALLRAHRPLLAILATAQTFLGALTFGVLFQNELLQMGTYFSFHSGTSSTINLENGLPELLIGVGLFTISGLAMLVWNHFSDQKFPPLELEDSRW
jgi:hypothetical protein